MDVGRPSKYGPDTLEKARNYLINWKSLGDKIPSNAGLACELGVCRDTVNQWCKEEDKVDFSDIVKEIQVKQERELVNNGLDSTFNSNITKLVLNKHGYHEKQEIDQKGGFTLIIEGKDASTL